MGFFSKIWDGIKDVVSGVGNFIKSAFSGKNIWKTIGVVGAAYFGGAALGYWESPILKSINGVWSGANGAGGMIGSALGSEGWLGKALGQDAVSRMTKAGGDLLDADMIKDGTLMADGTMKGMEAGGVEALLGEADKSLRSGGGLINAGQTGISPDFYGDLPDPSAVSAVQSGGSKVLMDGTTEVASDLAAQEPTFLEEAWDYGASTPVGQAIGGVVGTAEKFAEKSPLGASIALSAVSGAMKDDPATAAAEAKRADREYVRNNFQVGETPSQRMARVRAFNSSPSAKIMNKEKLANVGVPITMEEWEAAEKEKQLTEGYGPSAFGVLNHA